MKFLNHNENTLITSRRQSDNNIPEKLQKSLEYAFYFGFKQIEQKDKQLLEAEIQRNVVLKGDIGYLGITLPDISLFISMMIKTIHAISVSYGFDDDTDDEKAYSLLLISTPLSIGEQRLELNHRADRLAGQIDYQIETSNEIESLTRLAAEVLSESLLVAKFVSGHPIVEFTKGHVNEKILRRISKYSTIKYKKRYLNKKATIGVG